MAMSARISGSKPHPSERSVDLLVSLMPTDPKTERGVLEVVYDLFELVCWIGSVVCDPIGSLFGVLLVLGLAFCFSRQRAQSAEPPIPDDPPYVDREHEFRHVAVDPWGGLNKKIVIPDVS
jgi:hypothetical protein